MDLPAQKTKIVATIGPASIAPEILEGMIRAGMSVARLNFSHGDFEQHAEVVRLLRAASVACGRRIAILADLPGPKMRLGEIPSGLIELEAGNTFTLTSDDIPGDRERVSMSFEPLPRVVKPGDRLFLNDGLVQLLVDHVLGNDVVCQVAVGGPISSRKGLNLPGIDLGISAFTDHDRKCLEFALGLGVDAVSQSFVECAKDMEAVRTAARTLGKNPFLIAKIERAGAIERFEEILAASDGIMVARGDLGVEIPIEEMAIVQKRLITRANRAAKPVITATQMLESMTSSRLPTRAEATDVANAILDGTDCVMLSAESAMGRYPVPAVAMLAQIAAATEAHRAEVGRASDGMPPTADGADRKAYIVEQVLSTTHSDAILVPSKGGETARLVARSRPPVWILAVSSRFSALQSLCFSAGVFPIELEDEPSEWNDYARGLTRSLGLTCRQVLLVAGPSAHNPHANQRLEIMLF